MKIAFVCNEYPLHERPGGIGVFMHTLAHGLVAAGHQVSVVGIGRKAGQDDDEGVRVVTLPECTVRGLAWLVNRRRLHSWLESSARAGEIDIVETPEFGGLLPFRFPACPVVIRLHMNVSTLAHIEGKRPRRLLRWLEKQTLSSHRNWIGVSQFVLRQTVSEYAVQPARYATIPNPTCELRRQAEPPSGLPRDFVLYAGTVRKAKGAFVLAEAAKSLLAAFPQLHLVYVGKLTVEDGLPADKRIRRIVGERLRDRVRCLGPLEHGEVLACMDRARLLALPSMLEACSLVPLEAMSRGLPVVYTTTSSGPEMIEDGVTGLLADPRDPDDVAGKITRILRDDLLAATLVKNASVAVRERFSLERCLRETLRFYEACLGQREAAA